MKKIAFINQRYGLEVNGGSEYYTRLIAEKLSNKYDVEILTSKALSYDRWRDYYTNDVEEINGVTVRRFSVAKERKPFLMKILTRLITKLHLNFKWLCDIWVRQMGPYVPDLVTYIDNNKEDYDAFIFVTYLYYPTVEGMKKVKDKSILIPTAHEEPFFHFKSHRELFNLPKAIIYLTDEEKQLVTNTYKNQDIKSIVAGVGVDVPTDVDNIRFRKKYDIEGDYVVYVGRVEKDKGCKEMLQYFLDFYKKNQKLSLVIMGTVYMDIPVHPDIKTLGFVSEKDKFDGIAGAKMLWLPSRYESLSIAVLEAMSLSVPVLVNGNCDVLKGHCKKSDGGLYYTNSEECQKAINQFIDEQEWIKKSENAKEYIRKNYMWSQIINNINDLIEEI